VLLDTRVSLETLVETESWAPRATKALLASLAPSVPLVTEVPPVKTATTAPRAPEDFQELLVPPALLGPWVPEAFLVLTARKAGKVHAGRRATKVPVDLKVTLGLRALVACLVPGASPALKVLLALMVPSVRREIRA